MFDRLDLWKKQKKKLNLKYDDIANISNIPKGTIQNIFAGYIPNPRIDTVEAIERALGLSEWSQEEQSLGVGNHPIILSADEWEWLELRSEILEKGGQNMLATITELLKTMVKNQKK